MRRARLRIGADGISHGAEMLTTAPSRGGTTPPVGKQKLETPCTQQSNMETPTRNFRETHAPIVDIQGVNFTFGVGESSRQVLFDNHLTIHPGEIVIMTGPSGSGKTTLLTLIGALREVREGSLQVMGKELRAMPPMEQVAVRRNIGFIFQSHNLFDSLTAMQNVMLSLEMHDIPAATAKRMSLDILHDLGIGERAHYKPANLSGGQQQRVAIGRALVHRPRIVLADEPTAALDKDTGRMVVELFRNMAREHLSTVFIVTHDNRILDVADRIVSMVDGYIISDTDVAASVSMVNFLLSCELFSKFSPELLANVAGKMVPECHLQGSDIVVQGDVGDKFYVIKSGRVRVLKETDGRREEVAILGAGQFFGELALMRDEPRAATVQAMEGVELLSLGKDLFLEAIETSSSFEHQLKKVYFYR